MIFICEIKRDKQAYFGLFVNFVYGVRKRGIYFITDGFELLYWHQNGNLTRFKKSSSSLIVVISMNGFA